MKIYIQIERILHDTDNYKGYNFFSYVHNDTATHQAIIEGELILHPYSYFRWAAKTLGVHIKELNVQEIVQCPNKSDKVDTCPRMFYLKYIKE